MIRCVPVAQQPVPRDCSELECEDGFVCMVADNRAMCVRPQPPEGCDSLNCEEMGLVCRAVAIANGTAPVCVPSFIRPTCEDLNCADNEVCGFQVITGVTSEPFTYAACLLREVVERGVNSCANAISSCGPSSACVDMREGNTFAGRICIPLNCSTRDPNSCDPDATCQVINETISACVQTQAFFLLDTTCNNRTCPVEFGRVCQEIVESARVVGTICDPPLPTSCDDINCGRGDGCAFSRLGDITTTSFCVPLDALTQSVRIIVNVFGLPEPPTSTAEPPIPSVCEELNCEAQGLRCVSGDIDGSMEATCVPETVGRTCQRLRCESDDVCVFQEVTSVFSRFGSCLPRTSVIPFDRPSCGAPVICSDGQVCVDLRQDGIQYGTSCNAISCSSDPSICESGYECLSARTAPALVNFDSVCIEASILFQFNTTCAGRVCNATGTVCQEAAFEGTIVGTFCSFPTFSTCDTRECPEGTVCVFTEIEGIFEQAVCAVQDEIVTTLALLECAVRGDGCQEPEPCRGSIADGFPVAFCLPDVIARTCDELTCDHFCTYHRTPSQNFEFAVCTSPFQVERFTPERCSETSLCAEEEICVDRKQLGIQLGVSCIITDCLNNPGICESGFTCQDVQPRQTQELLGVQSICVEDSAQFQFNTSCEDGVRCGSGLVCQEITFDGTTIGTICAIRAPQATTCELVTPCPEGEMCTFVQAGDVFMTGTCVIPDSIAPQVRFIESRQSP